ncbi:MAG TPA: DUF3182 family protein [Azospirillum sp.]|nr:DUF3182 family protein [Azospirillum sp.]
MKQRKAAASNILEEAPPSCRGAVVCLPGERGYECSHERATCFEVAKRLAVLKGFDAVWEYDAATRYPGPVYFLPSDTLVGVEAANALGIRGEHDLFGGVVPSSVVGTKAITHPLVGPDAEAPAGWSRDFGHRVQDVVLSGFSAFTFRDARRAGMRLLEHGPVRVKRVQETGGRGQTVVFDAAGLEAVLEAVDPAELAQCGLVLEENLADVTTYSVGQVRVADLVASYHGTQRLTPDNGGAPVYGGSELVVVRGEFDAMPGLGLAEEVRLAVMQGRAYDAAASQCFPELFASRRNYDVAQGLDQRGRRRSGVLEQSWRIGGASSAEIAALEAFRADPLLRAVRAICIEAYGESEVPPPNATVYFRGVDERVGFITKYTLVEPYGDT